MLQDREIIDYNGEKYMRIMAKPVDRHIIGIDLAQSRDFTCIAGIHFSKRALDTFTVRPPKRPGPGWHGLATQDTESFFYLRRLERLPNGTRYPDQVAHIDRVMAHPKWKDAEIVCDATGIGSVVCDMLEAVGLRPVRVIFTGGHETTWHSDTKFSVPKPDIFDATLARLHSEELILGSDLELLEPLREEFKNFELLSRSATGHERMGATGSKNDDLLTAVSLAVFWATQGKKIGRHGEVGARHVRGLI